MRIEGWLLGLRLGSRVLGFGAYGLGYSEMGLYNTLYSVFQVSKTEW